jgi:hypothetical protein
MLTDADQQEFLEHGFLVFEGLLRGERLDHYLGVFDELVERGCANDPGGHWSFELDDAGEPRPGLLHKVQGVCVVEPRVLDLAREPEIVDRVAQLLDCEDVDVFGTKFFPKLPGGGTSTHWHQDNYYFGTTADQIISCGIYLQDADLDNGCLQVVPQSHHSGEIAEHQHTQGTHGSWTQVDAAQAVALPLPAGSVVFFSANLLHGTADNQSERTRYSTAWHYIPGDLALERFPRGGYGDRHIVREG